MVARRGYVHEIFAREDIEKNKIVAACSYVLFFLPLIICPYSAFGRFHANQSAVLFICVLGNIFLRMFLSFIPVLGNIVFFAAGVACLIFAVRGMINAMLGLARSLPLIGRLRLM